MNVYYPSLWELVILILVVVNLIWFGHLFKGRWESNNEPVPVAVALLMWCGMVAVYVAISSVFYFSSPYGASYDPATTAPNASVIADGPDGVEKFIETPPTPDRRLTLLTWLLLFWFIPMGYYISIVVNSVSTRTVDRIGPFSGEINEPSEFAEARRQALHGDVDGAVAIYRRYEENRSGALLEAARLLKSEDRFADAAKLYDEIADRYQENQTVWADASLQLARLLEKHLMNRDAAAALYRQIIESAAGTRFAQAANTDLNRLQILSQMHDGEEAAPVNEAPDPFYVEGDARTGTPDDDGGELFVDDPLESPVPMADPFLAARMRTARKVADAPAPVNNNARAPKKKAAAKKKTSAKKKTAAKKKPAAKKKASPKKRPSK